jgi:hypothetical protein
MRNIAALLTLTLILCLSSCQKENPEEVSIKEVEFSLGGIIKSNKSAANLDDGDPVPSSILVTILDSNGDEIYNREPIDILRFGDAFVSEKINLLEGNFSLSEFFVLDADAKIVYAAPKEGSAFAQLVNDPLNIDFNTVDKEITEVQVEVLKAEYATPDKFGYGSFELNIVGTIDIQVAISAYDYDTEQLQLTTAELTVTDNEGNDVSISLGDSTNVIRVRDSLVNYYISITKEAYASFVDTLSFTEISTFEVGKNVLKVTLMKLPTIDDGMVLHLPFDGNANDISGNNNNGSVNGAILVPGRFNAENSAYYFESNSFIEVPHDTSIDFSISDSYSISLWMKVGEKPTSGAIISKWTTGFDPYPYVLRIDENGERIAAGRYIGSLPQDSTRNQTAIYKHESSLANEWHHICTVFSPDYIKIYFNGELKETRVNYMVEGDISNNYALFIGKTNGQSNRFFTGAIDDIRIYNRLLSKENIKTLSRKD